MSSKKNEKPVWSAGIILAVIAAVCTTLVALTYGLTEVRIAENDRAWLEQSLQPALTGVVYDNNLLESTLEILCRMNCPATNRYWSIGRSLMTCLLPRCLLSQPSMASRGRSSY